MAGGVNLLDAVTRHGVKKFIFSSTAATYGEPEIVPIPEDHRKAPINPYGKSKLVFEQILADYQVYTELKYVSLRYFNAAGASKERGEHHRVETHLIPRVLDAASGSLPHVDVFGTDYATPDGTCVRDYIHVNDLASAHIRALEHLAAGKDSFAANVGTGVGASVQEVISAVEKVTGKKVPRTVVPRRPGDPPALVANPAKAQALLHWKAERDLNNVVSTAWNFMEKRRTAVAEK